MEKDENSLDFDLAESYLLGELNEKKLFDFEVEVFTEDSLSEQLDVVRNELSEKYLCNELTAERKKRFEDYFLSSPYNAEIFYSTQSLLASIATSNEVSENKWLVTWFANWKELFNLKSFAIPAFASLLVILGIVGIFLFRGRNNDIATTVTPTPIIENKNSFNSIDNSTETPTQIKDVNVNSLKNVKKPEPNNSNQEKPPSSPTPTQEKPSVSKTTFAYIFLPISSRDVNAKESVITIRKNDTQSTLEFNYPKENNGQQFKSYKLTLENPNGNEDAISELPKNKNEEGKRKKISVASDKLLNGENVFRIIGISENGEEETLQTTKFKVKRLDK